MLLWDYCDAGTLQDVMDRALPPRAAHNDFPGQDFLPEGFVWHVMLGLLRALQFLHQGIREGYEIEEVPAGDGGAGRRWKRVRGAQTREEDWMPILHRDLQPRNVFRQRPRGIETYGAVKLGGFGNCFVSGTVADTAGTPLVAIKERDGSLAELREKLGRFRRDEKQMPLVREAGSSRTVLSLMD
jgi:serine/threonine protein kinase